MDMENLIIRRPIMADLEPAKIFFEMVLKHSFQDNGIDKLELLNEEIGDKENRILEDLNTDGRDRYFLLAEYDGSLVGSIEYGPTGKLINECTENSLSDLFEIGTVFVHPDFQKKGISALLLESLFRELRSKKVERVCFDSGYPIAQRIWNRTFGKPAYCFENYWGEDAHHMIWIVNIDDHN